MSLARVKGAGQYIFSRNYISVFLYSSSLFLLHFCVLAKNTWKLKFWNSVERMKYLGINLTKFMQFLGVENYKLLMKEIKEDLSEKRVYVMFIVEKLKKVVTQISPNLMHFQ